MADDVEVLHCWMGHVGKVALDRLVKEDRVRGLEGAVLGEVGVCRGCELARLRPHPHHLVGPAYRATVPLKLVHEIWRSQSGCSHREGQSTCLYLSTTIPGSRG